MADINSLLKMMRRSDAKGKGDYGEEALWTLCTNLDIPGMQLYHSYKYPYQEMQGTTLAGNIIYENKQFKCITDERLVDEIDILLVTPYKVFPIEVKSYHSKYIDLYDHWMNRDGSPVHKSAVTQTEKHARHLYNVLSPAMPDGSPAYINPILVFVDRCTLRDDRQPMYSKYIPACTLNSFKKLFNKLNTPIEYRLDLPMIRRLLKEKKISIRKEIIND